MNRSQTFLDPSPVYPDGGKPSGASPAVVLEILTATVELSSAQILSCVTTPIVVIPAPGAGKAVIEINALGIYNFGTTPYSEDIGTWYQNNAGQVSVQPTGWITPSNSEVLNDVTSYTTANLAGIENKPIVITAASTNPTGGDGNAVYVSTYVILDVP